VAEPRRVVGDGPGEPLVEVDETAPLRPVSKALYCSTKAMAEQAAPPPTASLLFGRWFGGPAKGLKAVTEYDRERAHVYALERLMREKKCVAVNVDRELAEINAEMAKIRGN